MLNEHKQIGASSYESQFGPVQDDFPPNAGRPRRPVRPAGRIALSREDMESFSKEESPASEPGEHSVFEVEFGPAEHSTFKVESISGVAMASMIQANTRLV
jgi:hypothetical protein